MVSWRFWKKCEPVAPAVVAPVTADEAIRRLEARNAEAEREAAVVRACNLQKLNDMIVRKAQDPDGLGMLPVSGGYHYSVDNVPDVDEFSMPGSEHYKRIDIGKARELLEPAFAFLEAQGWVVKEVSVMGTSGYRILYVDVQKRKPVTVAA